MLNFQIKKDIWTKTQQSDYPICVNPSLPHFLQHKIGLFQNITGIKNDIIILENLAVFKSHITNSSKIKTLVILPNKTYCHFLENDYKRHQNLVDNFDFTFKNQAEITYSKNREHASSFENYDLVFLKEDVVMAWALKKQYQFKAKFAVALCSNFLNMNHTENLSHLLEKNI